MSASSEPYLPAEPRRRTRRPFLASMHVREGYRLAPSIAEPLAAALAPYRNRAASWALAHLIAEVQAQPGKVTETFPLDRRALAELPRLTYVTEFGTVEPMTESLIRGAVGTLQKIKFVLKQRVAGSGYHETADGLRRMADQFRLSAYWGGLLLEEHMKRIAARARDYARRLAKFTVGVAAVAIDAVSSVVKSPKEPTFGGMKKLSGEDKKQQPESEPAGAVRTAAGATERQRAEPARPTEIRSARPAPAFDMTNPLERALAACAAAAGFRHRTAEKGEHAPER